MTYLPHMLDKAVELYMLKQHILYPKVAAADSHHTKHCTGQDTDDITSQDTTKHHAAFAWQAVAVQPHGMYGAHAAVTDAES